MRYDWSDMQDARSAKFKIGQVVKHRLYPFRGVIFDIDPVFNNTEEWWQSIPAEIRPRKDQPFYHLFAENAETEYIAYVSEQNLLPDTSGKPIRHPDVAEVFERDESGTISSAQFAGALIDLKRKGAARGRAFVLFTGRTAYFFCAGAGAGAGTPGAWLCWPSSFLRASSAFFCNSSCSLRLLFLESLRIRRRAVIGLGEIVQRQRQADRRALHVDRLHDDVLPLLHLGDHVVGDGVIRHAADRETDLVGLLRGLLLIDDQPRAMRELHSERNGDPQDLRSPSGSNS